MIHRKIIEITQGRDQHWVGNGFPVNNMFSYGADDNISPFLLLDYAKPTNFPPSNTPRGVGIHPHRGFETVTIVYDGELQHKDTAGNHGKIGPGDVQWMTAARGILHEEKHSDEFTRKGGRLEMVQLWVNLPAKNKMSQPRYQEILNTNIPSFEVAHNKGNVRIIAGSLDKLRSKVNTFTPIDIYDIHLKAGATLDIPVKVGFNALLLVLDGKANINGTEIKSGELIKFSMEGELIPLAASADLKLLYLSGQPINEPVAGHGPFVMNTQAELKQAYIDFRSGNL